MRSMRATLTQPTLETNEEVKQAAQAALHQVLAEVNQQITAKEANAKVNENPLPDFSPYALHPELSNNIVDLLIRLSFEIEALAKKAGCKDTNLEIYGSFVLYFAMRTLKKEMGRRPRDLDLLIQLEELKLSEGGFFLKSLLSLGFTEKERNPAKGYIKLEKPLKTFSVALSSEEGMYDLELTLAFKGYKSINPIHLTRHRLRFNHATDLVSFDGGDEKLKKELLDAILSSLCKVELWGLMRPSLDQVNLFSRLLKCYFEYKDSFKMDEESTRKILNDPQTIKNYFRNRLRNALSFNVDIELAKDSCYLEMADLIARHYFTHYEAKPIILGFVSVLLEALCQERSLPALSEEQIRFLAIKVTELLQDNFKEEYYQPDAKKKAQIVEDFYHSLVQTLATVLRNVYAMQIPWSSGLMSMPLIVQDWQKKKRHSQTSPFSLDSSASQAASSNRASPVSAISEELEMASQSVCTWLQTQASSTGSVSSTPVTNYSGFSSSSPTFWGNSIERKDDPSSCPSPPPRLSRNAGLVLSRRRL